MLKKGDIRKRYVEVEKGEEMVLEKKNRDTSLEYPHGVVVKHLENPPIKDGPP